MYNLAVFVESHSCATPPMFHSRTLLSSSKESHASHSRVLSPGSRSFTSRPYDFDSASYKRNPALWSWCLTACPQHLVFRGSSSSQRASLRYPFVAGNRNATSWLFIHQLMEVWVGFIFIIVNNATVNNRTRFCADVCFHFSQVWSEEEGLAPRVTLCLIC